MHWYEPANGWTPKRVAAYGAVALLALGELVIFGLAITPRVDPGYRAFYIDRTTTCRDMPVSGSYQLGETVSFFPHGAAEAKEIRVCGLSGPVADGTHSLGTSSRLRVGLPRNPGPLDLALEMRAVWNAPQGRQRVIVSVNGVPAGEAIVTSSGAARYTFAVPEEVMNAAPATLEILLEYPEAVLPGPLLSDLQSRAIKLYSFALLPEGSGEPILSGSNGLQTPIGPAQTD